MTDVVHLGDDEDRAFHGEHHSDEERGDGRAQQVQAAAHLSEFFALECRQRQKSIDESNDDHHQREHHTDLNDGRLPDEVDMRLNVIAQNAIEQEIESIRTELTPAAVEARLTDAHRRLWTNRLVLQALGSILTVTTAVAVELVHVIELEAIGRTVLTEFFTETKVTFIIETGEMG